MSSVNKGQILKVYAQVNPALDIEGDPLFLENFESLTKLITSTAEGQRAGAAEVVGSGVDDFEGIVIDTDEDGESEIMNTGTPEESPEYETEHEGGEGEGEGKGQGESDDDSDKEGEGEESDGNSDRDSDDESSADGDKESKGGKKKSSKSKDGKSEGKDGKGSGGKGKSKSSEKGEKSKGEGEGEGEGGGEGEGKPKQGQGQAPQPQDIQSQVEAMDDNELLNYRFRFQSITKTFFGQPMCLRTQTRDGSWFYGNERVMMTGIYIALYDTILKRYANLPEKELSVRKNLSINIIEMIENLTSSACLELSDDEGNPIVDKREELIASDKMLMVKLIIGDKLAERLLPLFFIFRKELFTSEKIVSYVATCLSFLQQSDRFVCIRGWHNDKLETSNFIFVNREIESNLKQGSVAFWKTFNVKERENKFERIPLYEISDAMVSYTTTNDSVVAELQMFIRELITDYFVMDANSLYDIIRNKYYNLMSCAELRIADLMKMELDELASYSRQNNK